VMNWLKKYLKTITAETYTFCGLAIAYFTLEGSAKKSHRIYCRIRFHCVAHNNTPKRRG